MAWRRRGSRTRHDGAGDTKWHSAACPHEGGPGSARTANREPRTGEVQEMIPQQSPCSNFIRVRELLLLYSGKGWLPPTDQPYPMSVLPQDLDRSIPISFPRTFLLLRRTLLQPKMAWYSCVGTDRPSSRWLKSRSSQFLLVAIGGGGRRSTCPVHCTPRELPRRVVDGLLIRHLAVFTVHDTPRNFLCLPNDPLLWTELPNEVNSADRAVTVSERSSHSIGALRLHF